MPSLIEGEPSFNTISHELPAQTQRENIIDKGMFSLIEEELIFNMISHELPAQTHRENIID